MGFRLLPSRGTRKGAAALDWWTIPHVLSGVALAVLLEEFWIASFLLVVYEVVEALLRRIKTKSGAGVFEYESWPNIVADVVVALLGWGLARALMALAAFRPLLPF